MVNWSGGIFGDTDDLQPVTSGVIRIVSVVKLAKIIPFFISISPVLVFKKVFVIERPDHRPRTDKAAPPCPLQARRCPLYFLLDLPVSGFDRKDDVEGIPHQMKHGVGDHCREQTEAHEQPPEQHSCPQVQAEHGGQQNRAHAAACAQVRRQVA